MSKRRGALYALIAVAGIAVASAQNKATEWPTYGADLANTRYRPLDQINSSNFSQLELAWVFKTDNMGTRPEYKLEGTPLMVKGVLYAVGGTRRSVVALDAASGEVLWVHGEHEGERAMAAPRQLSGRGVAYWTDGKEERILYVTPGYRLVALDAKTGVPVHGFGESGLVDLKLNDDQTIFPDLTTGEIGLQSAPVVAGNTVIIGASFREGMTPKSMRNNKGYVRGFDVRTGKRLWIFHTIPIKTEPGYDSWLNGSAEYTGNTGVWTQISVDEKLRPGLPPGGIANRRLLWRPSTRQQAVWRKPRLRGSEDRRTQVAFPAGTPSAVGHGHFLRAASSPISTSMAARSKRWRSRPSRAFCTCSIV